MQEDKRRKRSNRHAHASKFKKMYRRFVWGILFYLRQQSPVQAVKYNENVLRLRAEVSDLEDRNIYLQHKIDNIEVEVEDKECDVAEIDAKIGSPLVELLESFAKLFLGIVPVIVLFQIFGISLANFGESWQNKLPLIVIIFLVSITIVLLTSSLIIGAFSNLKEEEWNRTFLRIPFRYIFISFCIIIVIIEGYSGGYLASELIQGTARQENQQKIEKIQNNEREFGKSKISAGQEDAQAKIRSDLAKDTKQQIEKLDNQLVTREKNIDKHTGEVQTFMAILASVNIAWSVIKGNKLTKTKTVRGKRSSSAKRVNILRNRMSKYAKNILANQKKIEALEKIIANYWEDEDVKDTYTGTSRNNTAGQDYTAKYPPMPDPDDWFDGWFDDDDLDDEEDYEPDIDEEDGDDREKNTDGGDENDV